LKLISFRISGAFAAFRDPSVTTNQTAYYIPSKSAVIGILGAIIGIPRSNTLRSLYSDKYLEFFKTTKIGLQFESEPKKVAFFTNHRSLKEAKTKPFKTEVVENPKYTVYVDTDKENLEKISSALAKNKFAYPPYLGHAYCPARVSDFSEIDAGIADDAEGMETRCVVLDESETYNPDFRFKPEMIACGGSAIIERHIHHFFDKEKFDGRVLKHWIPTNNSRIEIHENSKRLLSKFYETGGSVVCMY